MVTTHDCCMTQQDVSTRTLRAAASESGQSFASAQVERGGVVQQVQLGLSSAFEPVTRTNGSHSAALLI